MNLCIFGHQSIETFLNDVIAVKILNQLDNFIFQGDDHRLNLESLEDSLQTGSGSSIPVLGWR